MRAILTRTSRKLCRTRTRNQVVSANSSGHDGEGDQRQAPVEPEEHHHDAGEDHQVAEDRDDAGGEHLVEGVDVGGHPGDQAADRVLVVEAQRQALEAAEDLPAADRS